jgi:hypothetical protein
MTLMPIEQIEFTGANGLRLAADAAGPADGLPVLLMHGGGQTRNAWGRALQDLGAQGWRAIAIDARGHGESGWASDGDYGMDTLCADLRAIVRTLSSPPVLVLGHEAIEDAADGCAEAALRRAAHALHEHHDALGSDQALEARAQGGFELHGFSWAALAGRARRPRMMATSRAFGPRGQHAGKGCPLKSQIRRDVPA